MEVLFNSQQVDVECPQKVNHLEITELGKHSQHTAVTDCTLRNGKQDENSPWFKAEAQTLNVSRTSYEFVNLLCGR